MKFKLSGVLILFCIFSVFSSLLGNLWAAEGSDSRIDTTVYHEKIPPRSKWEQVFYVPGAIVYAPFKYTLRGIGWSVGYIDDSRIIDKVNDWRESDDGRQIGEPTYSSRGGFGINYYENGLLHHDLNRNRLKITATVGFNGAQKYQAHFTDFSFSLGYMAEAFLRYRKLVTERFYGVGNNTPKSAATTYTLEQTTLYGRVGYDLEYDVHIHAKLGYEFTNIAGGKEDGLPPTTRVMAAEQFAPGVSHYVSMGSLSLQASRNTKNAAGNPTKGMNGKAYLGVNQQIDDDDFGFVKYGFDVTSYREVFYQRVIALRLAAEITNPLSERNVPFYYMAQLGEDESIRGFHRGRFHDHDYILGSVEYRYPIWRSWDDYGLDALLFFDAGQVSQQIYSKVRLDGFKAGYGFGFRFWGEENLISSLYFGWSEETFRMYFKLN